MQMTLFLYQNSFEWIKHYTTCSPMDLWMGAVRMRVQTADKNITIIHKYDPHNFSPSINVLWSEKLSVCKKQIHH